VLDKGQEDDWFSSRRITIMMVGAIVALGAFVWNEWRHDNPIVDLKLLKLRNFSTSVFMMFVLGMVLFGTTVLIPQFLQVQMGYTAEQAGKALSVGAFVLMFMMPLVGRLITRVDPRLLIAVGFTATSLALFHMTSIYTGIDFRTATMMRVYQVFGLAFVFIPISTLSYIGVPRNKSNQVSGITNLARNLGGSIGISMLSTFLLRLSQKHQTYLAAHTSGSDPAFTQRIAGLTANLTAQGIPANRANQQAYAIVGRMVGSQAASLAYIDIISAMAIAVLFLVPFVLVMKKPPKGARAAAAH
jgi:DHA2 family multidrug resistance protein